MILNPHAKTEAGSYYSWSFNFECS